MKERRDQSGISRRSFFRQTGAAVTAGFAVIQKPLFTQPPAAAQHTGSVEAVLKPESFRHDVDAFNARDQERIVNYIDNKSAWHWIRENVPLFECSDKSFEECYYFRWWTYRKHIKKTPAGFVITEFLPDVPWAGKYNSISCAAGHHYYEGRWIRNPEYLNEYSVFWFRKGGEPRRYSFWRRTHCTPDIWSTKTET
jgi:hypothetical protein